MTKAPPCLFARPWVKVLVQRQAVRMHFPAEEISDLGFFDRLPTNATPSAKFFWKDLPESHSWPRPRHQKRTGLERRMKFRKSAMPLRHSRPRLKLGR